MIVEAGGLKNDDFKWRRLTAGNVGSIDLVVQCSAGTVVFMNKAAMTAGIPPFMCLTNLAKSKLALRNVTQRVGFVQPSGLTKTLPSLWIKGFLQSLSRSFSSFLINMGNCGEHNRPCDSSR